MKKRLITIGDSITKGTYTGENDWCPLSLANPNFSERIKEAFAFDELINYGMNGISVSATSKTNPEYALNIYIDQAKKGDCLVIAGGTNDYGTNVMLGNIGDDNDISFYGALDVLYRKVAKVYNGTQVYVITPMRRIGENNPNKVGYILENYRMAIREKCLQYGFYIIEGFNIPINPDVEDDRKKYILDGLHPNTEGHLIYAEYVINEMKKFGNV